MTHANVAKFVDMLRSDPAIDARLAEGLQNREQLLDRFVAIATEVGLPISRAEAHEWMVENLRVGEGGELGDAQLDHVAGADLYLHGIRRSYQSLYDVQLQDGTDVSPTGDTEHAVRPNSPMLTGKDALPIQNLDKAISKFK